VVRRLKAETVVVSVAVAAVASWFAAHLTIIGKS
jgi:hypothetical protein